jgi:PucR family transcriptional regulator, purine catabolism regulatory protein
VWEFGAPTAAHGLWPRPHAQVAGELALRPAMVNDSGMQVSELAAALAPRVTLLAGVPGLGATVRWVHATDLADPSPYLKGGELVLTNGQWRHGRSDSRRYVELLSTAQAAAIGYGLRKQGAHTPSDLVDACERAGMPLLEIPHDMAFVEISELVATQYAEQSRRSLLRQMRRDEALLSSVTGGAGIDGTLAILARDHGLELMLVDRSGQTLGSTVPAATAPPAAALAAAVEGVGEVVGRGVGAEPVTVFPVAAHGDVEALLVCFRSIADLTVEQRSAIGHELVFVGLELAQALATRELAERMVDELPELIAAGEARAPELGRRLVSLGLDPAAPITAIALVPARPGDPAAARRTARIATRLMAARGISGIAPVDGQDVLVIAALAADGPGLAAELVAAAEREGCAVCAGVGSPTGAGARDVRRSLGQARLAADYARLRGGGQHVATHAEAGSYRVLLAGQDAGARLAFGRSVLGPVLEQDRRRATGLIDTLDAFLREGGHWQRVADELHLHVNTLRYRIGRVEQLTGRSLSSFEERVNFFIALEALRDAPSQADLEDPPN